MGRFVKGDVVVIPFPFSDLTAHKRRPVLVVAELAGDDLIFCSITTQNDPRDPYRVPLTSSDFETGAIRRTSWIRASRVFTGDGRLITNYIGRLKSSTFERVLSILRSLFA